jgi:subtilase family serine protease
VPLDPTQQITLRVYLAGQQGRVAAALGTDVATVTGLDIIEPNLGPDAASTNSAASIARVPGTGTSRTGSPQSPIPVPTPAAVTQPSDTYQCSQYWDQYSETIPAAYGQTSAPTQLCGYTVQQLRSAYGVSTSPYTGHGETVAILSNGYWQSMLSDTNAYFAEHGVPGFAPGQFSDSLDAAVQQDDSCAYSLEESIDVESVHIAAPGAKVINVAGDCGGPETGNYTLWLQELLDAASRVVDQHLADVATGSFSFMEQWLSQADAAAWDLTLQQGALEGIGFDFSSGDGGPDVSSSQTTPVTGFPASDPWSTGVGGTSIAIGRSGGVVADYPWGDDGTQIDAAGAGYASPPPGEFLEGSGGGISTLFDQPGYQRTTVLTALATNGGTTPAMRVVPDISADAWSNFLIGYTGAIDPGVFSVVDQGGGTSAASPLIAGLEADAMQAAGHPLGFIDPALYRLGHKAVRGIPPVDPDDPPILIGAQPGLADGDNILTILGEDQPPLQATYGYDDVTGLGAPNAAFVTALAGLS